MPQLNRLTDDFKKLVNDVFRNPGSNVDLFKFTRKQGWSRLELMILDCALKGLPLETTHNTLLILKDRYIDMLEKMTVDIVKSFYKETD